MKKIIDPQLVAKKVFEVYDSKELEMEKFKFDELMGPNEPIDYARQFMYWLGKDQGEGN